MTAAPGPSLDLVLVDHHAQHLLVAATRCRILGLTTLNSLLQYVNWLVWEVCSVN